MLEVVEQDHLTITVRRPELAARQAVTNRDGKRQLGRAQSGTGYTDASGDKRSEHREESPSLVGERTGVWTVGGYRTESIEQRLARDAHLVEPQTSVVNAVETAFLAAVFDPYPGAGSSAFISDRHEEDMHPTSLAARE